ncbi:hypothetical protein [Corynebacterium phocae]|nr:hypothetical protein [Corynebacterium phocae]KAA8725923.1 hypothetical protein F4V58_03245 [Corynebacterium phocae]
MAEKLSDAPIGAIRQNFDFFLGVLAGTLSPFGSILVAPQLTLIVQHQDPDNWFLFAGGIWLMLCGLAVIPLWLGKRKKDKVENGITGRFVNHVDECVRAMTDYSRSGKSASDAATLYQKLTTEATYIIGHRARVCLYWRRSAEGRSPDRYELVRENAGERNPRARARSYFKFEDGDHDKGVRDSEKAANLSFLNAMDGAAERIVVQNVKKPPSGFNVHPNPANGYQSFILVPIRSVEKSIADRRTVGVLTVDFPGRKIITEEIELVTAAIAEMFSDSLRSSQDFAFRQVVEVPRESKKAAMVEFLKSEGGSD